MAPPYHVTVLGLCVLAFFTTMVARLAISPVVPLITDDFAISNTAIGLALTGMWFAYGLTQFPSGVLADRYGEKPVILLSVGGTGVMCVALALSPAFAIFTLVCFAIGAVAGLHYSVATMLLSRTWDDLGTAIGVHTIGSPLAGLLAPIAAAWVGVRFGWRPAVAIAVVAAVPAFVLFHWRIRSTEPARPEQPMRERFELGPLVELLARPAIGFSIAIAVIGLFVIQGLFSFLPTFLVEFLEYSPTLAGVYFSLFFVFSAIGRILVGVLSDRIGRDATIAGCMIVGCAGLVLFTAAPGLVVAGIATALIAAGTSFFSALDPRFLDHMDAAERGAGFGLVRTVYGIIGASGSIGVGLLSDLTGWATTFGVLAGLLGLVFLGLLVNAVFDLGY